ncbi:MAG TPA: heavy metal-responsive transcriptional regulator [Thermoanaerobaculia bacterium]|nr:heavy metal-responsive transcriptional regulator [Thermoanaerobaculia bacterium]
MKIGDVARACGVSADTIRYYEARGVIAAIPRDASGYRDYPPEVIERVRMIRRSMRLGFTLDELARIFKQRAAGKAPCREVRALAERKLRDVETRIAELNALRESLASTIETWDERLSATAEGEAAHLLEME